MFGAGTVLQRRAAPAEPERKALPKAAKSAPVIDDDMADIEAILKRRGIS